MFNILLVDDDKIQAITRKAVLSRIGDHVITIADGAETALGLIRRAGESSVDFDLVVTDHLMPGMNGPELVAAIRGLRPLLPILVLSGLPSAQSEYGGQGVEFRLKPFPPEELTALVHLMVSARMKRSA